MMFPKSETIVLGAIECAMQATAFFPPLRTCVQRPLASWNLNRSCARARRSEDRASKFGAWEDACASKQKCSASCEQVCENTESPRASRTDGNSTQQSNNTAEHAWAASANNTLRVNTINNNAEYKTTKNNNCQEITTEQQVVTQTYNSRALAKAC